MEEKISYEGVESSCEALHTIVEKLKSELEESLKNLNGIAGYNGVWKGKAANAFVSKIRSGNGSQPFEQSYTNVLNEIDNTVVFMAECSIGYQNLESNVINGVSSNLKTNTPSSENSSIYRLYQNRR